LNAGEIFDALAAYGARIAVDGERVKLVCPSDTPLPAFLINAARAHKAELRALAGQPRVARTAVPAKWLDGLTALDPNGPPKGFPAPWWRGLIRDAELFLSVWAKRAADLGWTTLDLFGAHSKAPAANFSCLGLLLVIRGGRVVALTAETAKIEQQSGARLTYTRRPPEAECVALWELPGGS
jgi:hypothetical protein